MKKISVMRVTNNSPEKFTILRISVLLGLGQGFVTGIRKLIRKLRIYVQAALRSLRKICCLNQSEV